MEVTLIKKTPLNDIHKDMEAKMTNFGGWEMPVEYEGIIAEHRNVRENCGLFDISHMGEIMISGTGAEEFSDYLLTNNVAGMEIGKVIYSPMCYEDGGVVDDLMIYRLEKNKFMLVVNAANTEKDFEWIEKQAPEDVKIENATQKYGLIALQGPKAEEVLQQETEYTLSELQPFHHTRAEVAGTNMIFSRTGYTGEDGFELYLPIENLQEVWQKLLDAGEEAEIMPIGLGARDTLRLEKTLCLYGHELDEDINPLQANLGWTVKFQQGDFIGKKALLAYKDNGYERELSGFIIKGRGIARQGYNIVKAGELIGEVTSGSYSPTLDENIGLGYIDRNYAEIGNEIEIEIRRRKITAEIVETPFV